MTTDSLFKPRSSLVVPVSASDKLTKAPNLKPDEFVLDLEDGVPRGSKEQGRANLASALRTGKWDDIAFAVRINAARTAWCHLDVMSLISSEIRPATIVLPKVECAADIGFLARLLDGLENAAGRSTPRVGIQAIIETAAGIARVNEIATADERLEALIIGYADLAAHLGRPAALPGEMGLWLPVQQAVLQAARSNGLVALDGPFLGVVPDEAFHATANLARDLGFDGKWAIHPLQIAALNEIFTPTEAELAHARAVIAALDDARRDGRGAVALGTQMIDEAMRLGAARLLAGHG